MKNSQNKDHTKILESTVSRNSGLKSGDTGTVTWTCLVINPITVDNFAAFFNCMPADRASDSVMAPT